MKFYKVYTKYYYMAKVLKRWEKYFLQPSDKLKQHKDCLSICQVDLVLFVM
jgi:hypothetical protein